MVTSRAVVGSSQMRISGLTVRAMAMTMRWRMPPENSKGYCSKRFSGSGMPTSRMISRARRLASALVMLSRFMKLSFSSSSSFCSFSFSGPEAVRSRSRMADSFALCSAVTLALYSFTWALASLLFWSRTAFRVLAWFIYSALVL